MTDNDGGDNKTGCGCIVMVLVILGGMWGYSSFLSNFGFMDAAVVFVFLLIVFIGALKK